MGERPQLNMRLDVRTAAVLAALQRDLNLGATNVVRLALIELARARGVLPRD